VSGEAIVDAWSAAFADMFGAYARRRVGRAFRAVRLVRGGVAGFAAVAREPGPAMIVMNHTSWWDPMIVLALRRELFRARSLLIPMDRASLERFRFLRRCGFFGIDPDDPAALRGMDELVTRRLAERPRLTIGLTPQGRFVDVRDRVEPRPGAAALLARHPPMRAWTLAVEYGFWLDPRPEIFLRLEEIEAPAARSTSAWQRRLAEAMESNHRALEAAVRGRDPGPFESVFERRAASHPVYDLWQRLRGRSAVIEVAHRAPRGNPVP
jgi:hypothetical protein